MLELHYMGLNHSDSNLVMRLPKEKLVFIVDTIPVGAFPGRGFIDVYPLETEQFMERVLKMDWERMIPGHPGQPADRLGTKKDVEDQLALIRYASDEVKKWAREGKCWEPAEKEVKLEKYESWPGLPGRPAARGAPLLRLVAARGTVSYAETADRPRFFFLKKKTWSVPDFRSLQTCHRLPGEHAGPPRPWTCPEGPQQIRRVVGHDQRHPGVPVHAAAQAGDARVGVEQRLRGEAPHRDDQLRLDQLDLLQQVRRALRHFVGLGIAVARRPALEHVGDVDVLAARSRPIAASMLSSSLPAWPTNGSPSRSSSAPGASPISSQSAFSSPTPNTVWVRVLCRPHAVQPGDGLLSARSTPSEWRRSPSGSFDFRKRQTGERPISARTSCAPAHASGSVSTSASSRPECAG